MPRSTARGTGRGIRCSRRRCSSAIPWSKSAPWGFARRARPGARRVSRTCCSNSLLSPLSVPRCFPRSSNCGRLATQIRRYARKGALFTCSAGQPEAIPAQEDSGSWKSWGGRATRCIAATALEASLSMFHGHGDCILRTNINAL